MRFQLGVLLGTDNLLVHLYIPARFKLKPSFANTIKLDLDSSLNTLAKKLESDLFAILTIIRVVMKMEKKLYKHLLVQLQIKKRVKAYKNIDQYILVSITN